MTRFFISLVCVVFAFACGASPVETPAGEVLGTAKQAVYLPYLYGFEGGTDSGGEQTRCDSDWANGECWVPNSKVHYVAFDAGSCSSWWQARFVEVWNEAVADMDYINSFLHEDAPPWALASAAGTGLPNGVIYQWRCDGALGVANASFRKNTSNSDDIDAGGGDELRQYKGGVLRVYSAEIEGSGLWPLFGDTERKRFARTLIRHELAHQFGHGHGGAGIMSDYSADWFGTEKWWTFDMYQAMACYNPSNGGLFSDC
jgi:hypothetical protein